MKKSLKIVALTIIIGLWSFCYTVKAENISDLQAQKDEIKQELSNATESLDGIQIELTDALEAVSRLEAQIVEGEEDLSKINNEIKEIEAEIRKTQEQLRIVEESYEKQRLMCQKRLVALYEMGETSYLDVLLNSKSISDFISNYYLIGEIAQYDNDLLDTIKREKTKIQEIKEQIVEKNNNLKANKDAQERTLIALENTRTIKNSYVSNLTQEEQELQAQIDEYQSKLKSLDSQILFLTAGEITGDYVGGEFSWPAPGYKTITSTFGTRFHPILKIYKTHTGTDIGAPYGATVVAANSGVVTTSSYLGGYGNAVIIDHGGGVCTIYAHGSELIAKVGETVERGQEIMKVGSTGMSTGPHLHFSVTVNGQYVDPMPYLTGSN